MDDAKLDQITKELSAIKGLLVVLLQHHEVKGENIAKALGVSEGRVSQMFSKKKYKKRKKLENE